MRPLIFSFLLIGVGLVPAGAAWLLRDLLLPGSLTFIYVALGLACLSGIAAYSITFNGIEKDIRKFTTYLIGGMVFKLFFGIISVTLVAILFKAFAREYVLSYFLGYLIFTALEVYVLMRNLRPNLKKDKPKTDEVEGVK